MSDTNSISGRIEVAIIASFLLCMAVPAAWGIDSQASGLWTNGATWVGGSVPGLGADVRIVAGHSITVDVSTARLNSFTNDGTLVFSNWNTALIASNVTVNGTIKHLPNMATTTNESGEWVPDSRIYIECTNLFVTSSGTINANALGYGGATGNVDNFGPGGGKYVGKATSWGGSYGGKGGLATTDKRYGSLTEPTDPGSGGGPWQGFWPLSRGGGAVYIKANGNVTVNGIITADGGIPSTTYGASGSGGSIYINCRTFAGTNGTISASGKFAWRMSSPGAGGGGGGGGRIALIYDPAAQADQNLISLPTMKFIAKEGTGSLWPAARPGTIFLTDAGFYPVSNLWGGELLIPGFTARAFEDLTVDDGLAVFTNGFQLEVSNDLLIKGDGGLEITNGTFHVGGNMYLSNSISTNSISSLWTASGAGFSVGSNLHVYRSRLRWYNGASQVSTAAIMGNLVMTNDGNFYVYSGPTNETTPGYGALVSVAGNIELANYSWIYPNSDRTNGGSPLFRMENLTLQTNSGVDAAGMGYMGRTNSAGFGPGGGGHSGNYAGGGGYGGAGAAAPPAPGGIAYGSEESPIHPGSSGGSRGTAYWPGNGGGLVRVEVNRDMTLNGTINADGGSYSSYGASGAGGGIYLTCKKMFGSNAVISAKAPNSDTFTSGGPGGGSIAI